MGADGRRKIRILCIQCPSTSPDLWYIVSLRDIILRWLVRIYQHFLHLRLLFQSSKLETLHKFISPDLVLLFYWNHFYRWLRFSGEITTIVFFKKLIKTYIILLLILNFIFVFIIEKYVWMLWFAYTSGIFTGTRSVSAKSDLHVIIGRRAYIDDRDLYHVTVTLRSPSQRGDYTEISYGGYRNQTARRFLIAGWKIEFICDQGSG